MNKKLFSTFVALAMFVSIFGILHLRNAYAVTRPTQTTVTNIAPTIETVYDDSNNGANPGDPTNAGSNVTFAFTYNDVNEDDIWVLVCDSAGVTPHATGGKPECDDGTTWSVSDSAQSTDGSGDGSESVTYTTSGGSAEENVWHAYVCDDETPSLCSSVSQGTGADDSPFNVNHVPTFELVYVNPAGGGDLSDTSIEPNDTVYFELKKDGVDQGIDDLDTDGGQDTVTVRICVDATANYAACTAGAQICEHAAFNPVTTDFECSNATLANAPYSHAPKDFEVFVQDNHNFDGTGTAGQTFTVTDVDPYITDLNEYSVGTISLSAGISTPKTYTVTVKDDNGDDDITAVTAALYQETTHTLSSGVCNSADENECYDDSDCPLTGDEVGSDIETVATCAFTVWFVAYDTQQLYCSNHTTTCTVPTQAVDCSGIGDENCDDYRDWYLHANPSDGGVITDQVDSPAIAVNALTALSVLMQSGENIAYGTVALDAVSTGTTATSSDIENKGNQEFDVLISGTDMATSPPTQALPALQQEWHHETMGFTWSDSETPNTAGPYHLETSASADSADTAGCLDLDMGVRTANDATALDNAIFWKIKIPATQPSGVYGGTNTFLSTGGECTGYDGSTPDGKDV